MSNRISLPKDRIRVLLLEGISDSAVELLDAAGYANVTRLPKALDGPALTEALPGVHMLGIRSRTQLTAAALAAADRLITVGCFCIGTNQVDLEAAAAARHTGVQRAVQQYPQRGGTGDGRDHHAAARHSRPLTPRRIAAAGTRPPRAATRCAGKTLGIVGYGNIGTQVSRAGRGLRHAGDLLRHRRPSCRSAMRGPAPRWTSCWAKPTSSPCTCRRRRTPSA